MSTIKRQRGYHFSFDSSACEQCIGHCCTGSSGYIWASINELAAMASYLELPFVQFLRDYTFREKGRFSLGEVRRSKNDFACVFFDKGCTIYPVRPKQCRTYPFWSHFKKEQATMELFRECPGVKRDDETKNRRLD
jgi:hypothetical protein